MKDRVEINILATVIMSLLLIFFIGCADSHKISNSTNTTSIDNNTPIADYELLFIGNSHSSLNNLPNLVAKLIEVGIPNKKANAMPAPEWNFLDAHLSGGNTQKLLSQRSWTHIMLQAQKYSSTGRYSYPTDAAEKWIRLVKSVNAKPILFPEWPRRGNIEEGQRVYELHLYIASQEFACVAPIGPVWDSFIAQYPTVILHANDGNHSNLNGALLTAFVFYQVITGNLARDLPYVSSVDVSESVQNNMRIVASTVTEKLLKCD